MKNEKLLSEKPLAEKPAKERWLNVLPVSGLRYPIYWILLCVVCFVFLIVLFSYKTIESWAFRNRGLSAEQQNAVVRVLNRIDTLRLDSPFLRWQKDFRSSGWLWSKPEEEPHQRKIRYKLGSETLFYYSEKQPLQVLLVGDSLAQSIELSLTPMLAHIPSIKLQSSGVVSSTLTNKHFVDWPQKLRGLFSQRSYDLVLVFIGANSCQAIREDGDAVVTYGSKQWPDAYKEKVRQFIEIIRNQGAATWWLMNPPMLKKDYQLCMQSIATLQRSVASSEAEEIIETSGIVAAEDGSYIQSKVVGGEFYSLRAKDGVHFTIGGSRLISQEILRRIYEHYNIRPEDNRLASN